jgi:tape measure domain-containing protein
MGQAYNWEAIMSAKDNGLVSTIKGAVGAIDTLDVAFNKFDGSASTASNGMERVAGAAGKSEGLLSKFKSALSFGSVFGLAQQGMQALTGGIGSIVSESANASDAINKFKSTMNFAGFTKKQTASATKDMKTYADQTVYELGDVLNTTAQLAANGVPGYQKLTKAAGNLNAVAGGNADTFKSVAMVMTQTAGAGKLTTENWNQLTDAIPGASGVLQAAMKKNGAYTGNFRDAMANGEITANEFNKAISQTGMTKAAKEAAKSTATFEGAIGNLQAGAVNAFLAIYDAIGKENITGFINGLTSVIDAAAPYIGKGIKLITSTIGMLGSFISGNFKGFDKFHKSLVNLVGADAAGKIVPVLAQIGGAIHDFVDIVKATAGVLTGGIKNYEQFSKAISTTVPKGVVDTMWGIAKAIQGLISAAASHPKAVATVIGALAGAMVLGKVGGILGKIGSSFSLIGKVAGGIGAKLFSFGKGADTVSASAGSAGKNITEMGSGAIKAGVGIGVAAAGFGLLVLAIAQLAKTGTAGLVALAGVTVAIAALAGVFALLGPTLTANALGIGVFGAAVLAVGVGIGVASAGIALLVNSVVALGANFTMIIPMLAAVGVGFAAMIAGFVTTLAANAPVIATGVLTIVTTMLTTLTVAIPQFVASGMALLLGILQGIDNNIGQITTTVLSIVANFLNAIAANLGQVINAGVSVLVAFINGIANNLGRIIDAAVNLIGSFLIGLARAIPKIADKAMTAVTAFVGGIGYALGKVLTSGGKLIETFATGILRGMGKSNHAASSIVDGIKGVLSKINLFSIGANAIKGLVNGIGSMANAVWDKVKGIADGISSGMKKLLGIHSPSRVMKYQVGKYIPLGLAEGIAGQIGAVSSAARQMAMAATPDVDLSGMVGQMNAATRTASGQITGRISVDQTTSQARTNQLLEQLVGKDSNVYMDGDRVGGMMDRRLGGQTENDERWSR